MEQVFAAIPSVLSSLGPNASIDEAVVFAAWSKCAGDLLRTRTAPVEFFENRLVVAVQDAMWRRHLEELSPQMLFKINGSLGHGTVRFIEFRVDENAVIGTRNPTTAAILEKAPPYIAPSLAQAANAIADENLREQFLSAAATYLAKQRDLKSETSDLKS